MNQALAAARENLAKALAALEQMEGLPSLDRFQKSPLRARAQMGLLESANMWVDRLELKGNQLNVRGWALALPRSGRLLVNGSDARGVTWAAAPDNLVEAFPELPLAITRGARFEIRQNVADPRALVSIEYCPSGASDANSRANAWHYLPDAGEPYPLPAGANVSRVIVGDMFSYKVGGATAAQRLDFYLQRMTGAGFADCGRILDWGCGCARVLRHIAPRTDRVFGGDIDAVNIEWCQANIPGFDFRQLPLLPETDYAESFFDVVFGISVMTHLREDIQDRWLAELARIVRPGGYAMLSIMGPTTQVMGGLSEEMMARTGAEGFTITDESNTQVEAELDGKAYYINVTHAHWYIEKRWPAVSSWEVVDIAPGLAANQDVVLLRNRK